MKKASKNKIIIILCFKQKETSTRTSQGGSNTGRLVRITGVEPARLGHQILNLARLPIPPYPHIEINYTKIS